jgi:thiosulfate/3-mercaptopyruvate sulfurtransferase
MKTEVILLVVLLMMCSSCSHEKKSPSATTEQESKLTTYNLLIPLDTHKLLSNELEKYIPIQVSKKEVYNQGHIRGSLNIWRPEYASDITEPYGGMIPSKEKLQNLLQSLGFEKGKTLLLYDAKANVDALRFAWVLNLYGFDDFKIISGGLKNWKDKGLDISTDKVITRDKTNYQLPDYFDKSILAEYHDVIAAIRDSNTLILDTRERYEYEGSPFLNKGKVLAYKKGAFSRGSIPTAIHLNWSTLVDLKTDHEIKELKDLEFDLKKRGISKEKNIILYCHSGSRTSHTYYVLKHVLGFENVKNYDGSWIEWSYRHTLDSTVPVDRICSDKLFKEKKDSLALAVAK